jgi:hypothetical protein
MKNESGIVYGNEVEGCVHHWIINEKNFGTCKKCGASKFFPTTWERGGPPKAGQVNTAQPRKALQPPER